MTSASLTTLLAALIVAGCSDKSAPDCATIGRKLGAIELEERHGHLAEFMTARERDAVTSRWTKQCESDRPTAAVRRCMAGAGTMAEVRACEDSTKPANATRTALQARWVQIVGGAGAQGLEAVVVAPDRDVIAAGYFGASVWTAAGSLRLATLGATTVTSAGGEDIWVARFAPDGAPRWLTRLGGKYGDSVDGLAVTASGAVVVGPRSEGNVDVDYGDGTDYLLDARAAGIPKPVVIVTLAEDGSVARAYALPVGGVAESIGSLPDGDLVVATRSNYLPRDQGLECGSPAYVLARVHEDGSLAWLRCNDAASRAWVTPFEARAHVAIGPGGALAMCASFAGRMSWAGQVGEATGDDESSSAFVVSLDPEGNVRWARYAYGDVNCDELAVTSDGTVAVRLDNYPSPRRVEIAGAEPANGPAVAAWSADGDPLWLRTCAELLGVPRCGIRSLVSLGDHLAVAARSGKDAVLAELDPRSAEVIDVRAVPGAALGTALVPYDGSFVFGTTSEAGVDLGLGVSLPVGDDLDALIGVLDPSNPGAR